MSSDDLLRRMAGTSKQRAAADERKKQEAPARQERHVLKSEIKSWFEGLEDRGLMEKIALHVKASHIEHHFGRFIEAILSRGVGGDAVELEIVQALAGPK